MSHKTPEVPNPDDMPVAGSVIAGKFLVERILGVGGMGAVVAARHLQLGQRVAIKFLLPGAGMQPGAFERFAREARIAASIQSEHAARVLDVGTLETGAPYLVMEHLTGTDLSKVVRSRGPLPIDTAIDYLLQACEALAEAHALGIVHRDLKPANLFIASRADGSALVKVIDFGISKVRAASSGLDAASLTSSSDVMGSPFYMSPEQIKSAKHVDTRADIWALGATLYKLLCGHPPFQGDSVTEVVANILTEPPIPPREYRPDIPFGLEAAILRCLDKRPESRPSDLGVLARALAPYGSPMAAVSVDRVVAICQRGVSLPDTISLPSDDTAGPSPSAWRHPAGRTQAIPIDPTLAMPCPPPGGSIDRTVDGHSSDSSRGASRDAAGMWSKRRILFAAVGVALLVTIAAWSGSRFATQEKSGASPPVRPEMTSSLAGSNSASPILTHATSAVIGNPPISAAPEASSAHPIPSKSEPTTFPTATAASVPEKLKPREAPSPTPVRPVSTAPTAKPAQTVPRDPTADPD